jgi:hypothetical protein
VTASTRGPGPQPPPPWRGGLSHLQLASLAFVCVFPTMVMLLPGDLVRLGGRYGWWTPLVAGVPAAGLTWALTAAAARTGDLATTALRGGGPLGGRLLLLAEWLALGAFSVVVVREAGIFSAATLVAAAVPIWIITLFNALPAALLAWLGPIVTGRVASLVVPVMLLTYLAVLLMILPGVHVVWALPLWPRNAAFARPRPVLTTAVWLAEPLVVGLALLRRIRRDVRPAAGRLLAAAVLLSALLTSLGTWVLVAQAGPAGVATRSLPVLDLVNRIRFGLLVQHLQSLVLPIETMGLILKVGVFLWTWSGVGVRLLHPGRPRPGAVALHALVATALGLVLLPNLLALDRAVYSWLGLRALPLLLGAAVTSVVAALLRRGAAAE